jgi:CheY-like chemotaxis protein
MIAPRSEENRTATFRPATGAETIVVAEDEDLLLELVKDLLEREGYSVITARDGQEAIERVGAQAAHITLVLSDLHLPKVRGVEMLARMKTFLPDVKVLFATGYASPNEQDDLMRAGAVGILQKPFEARDVLHAVRRAIDAPTRAGTPVRTSSA